MEKIAEFMKVSREIYGKEGYDDIILPKRATQGSAGYDFFAPYDFSLSPGESVIVSTGVRARIENGWLLMLLPRSGMGFKYGVRLSNTAGIIDSDYFGADNEGHIMIKLTGVSGNLEIQKGKAFAQGIFIPYGITLDDSCDELRRGGFGSTDGKSERKE